MSIVGTTLTEISKTWELQRDYMFELTLPDMGLILGTEVSKYCQDVTFEDYSISEVSQMRQGAYKGNYAGKLEVGDFSAVFLQPIPDLVSTYFYYWRSLIVDNFGHYYPKNNYAKSAYVNYLDQDDVIVQTYRLVNVFPKSVAKRTLSYGGSNIAKLEISFSMDRVYMV